MSATSEPARVAPGTVSFELERFERSDGRLELSGRWFGVRGMRFVRPTLMLALGDGTSSRALADLEHKPWAPLDGEPWVAAFPFGTDATVLDAELAVAPGIAVPLPAPGEELPDAEPIAALPADGAPADGAPARRKRRAPQSRRGRATAASDVPDELALLHEETQRLRQEPIRLQAELDRSEQLRQDVEDELERLKLDAGGALARRDQAVDRFENATTARDEAHRVRDEAIDARDSALAERKAALAERDAAVEARDSAAAERDGALRAREDALAERDKAVAERDAAISRCDQATAERQRALAERDKAVAERDKAVAERDQARAQRTTTVAVRSVAPVRSTPLSPLLPDDQDQLLKRAIAVGLLLVAGLALLIIVGVL